MIILSCSIYCICMGCGYMVCNIACVSFFHARFQFSLERWQCPSVSGIKKKIRTFIHVKALLKMFHLYPSFSAERKPEYFLLPRPSVIWLLLFPLAASHTSHLSYLHVLAVLLSFFGFYAHCFLPFCFFFFLPEWHHLSPRLSVYPLSSYFLFKALFQHHLL